MEAIAGGCSATQEIGPAPGARGAGAPLEAFGKEREIPTNTKRCRRAFTNRQGDFAVGIRMLQLLTYVPKRRRQFRVIKETETYLTRTHTALGLAALARSWAPQRTLLDAADRKSSARSIRAVINDVHGRVYLPTPLVAKSIRGRPNRR